MSQATNAMTLTAEPVQQSARPSSEQEVEIDQQTPNRTLQWLTRELQMEDSWLSVCKKWTIKRPSFSPQSK